MACQEPVEQALLRKGLEEFNRGLFFQCHETLEGLWRGERGHRRDFYKGLIQVAAGLHHLLQRRNFRGAVRLLERGEALLEPFSPSFLGVDVKGLAEGVRRLRGELMALGEEGFWHFDRSLLPRIAYQEQATPILRVKRLRAKARLPRRATPGSSGLDLFACLEGPGRLTLGRDPVLVPTGIAVEIPAGYEGQVRPRSGLSAQGVGVAFGTIDSDYRGEILVTMFVFGSRDSYTLRDGDRIAQLVIAPVAILPLEEVEELSPTERGAGGHGSTGL